MLFESLDEGEEAAVKWPQTEVILNEEVPHLALRVDELDALLRCGGQACDESVDRPREPTSCQQVQQLPTGFWETGNQFAVVVGDIVMSAGRKRSNCARIGVQFPLLNGAQCVMQVERMSLTTLEERAGEIVECTAEHCSTDRGHEVATVTA
jgi:hypothetical protein